MANSGRLQVDVLNIPHLERLWSRVTRRSSAGPLHPREWIFDKLTIHGLGLSLEETLEYLGRETPTLEAFQHWIIEKSNGKLDLSQTQRINAALSGSKYSSRAGCALDASGPVLTEDDLRFWDENGFVVVHEAVDAKHCEAAAQAVWTHLRMQPSDPDSWYSKPRDRNIMVQLFHHPALDANRRSPRIQKAFAQLWGTTELWVSIDRVSFNPPERSDWRFPGPRLHWDTTLAQPIPFSLSGILYLTDTVAEQGAFTCVPGFHRRIVNWLDSLPADADPREQDLYALGAQPIAGKAGDLVIWHEALPHGSSPNCATQPRIVQYITMYPASAEYNRVWR